MVGNLENDTIISTKGMVIEAHLQCLKITQIFSFRNERSEFISMVCYVIALKNIDKSMQKKLDASMWLASPAKMRLFFEVFKQCGGPLLYYI